MANRAGTPAQPQDLIDVEALVDAYADITPDPEDPAQRVVFGTSGHRGSAFTGSFNDAHIAAITQAVVEYRARDGIDGPLFLGRDTHALSLPAHRTALEVLAGNGVHVLIDEIDGYVPTPALSRAILAHNARPGKGRADGVVITPSHNPPSDGGIKYNPPHGGPAGAEATEWIADRANQLLENGLKEVRRIPHGRALTAETTGRYDYLNSYVGALPQVIDMEAIRDSGVRIGADPMGSASVEYWIAIAERYGLNMDIVNPVTDPRWAFMTLDWDEKIRMDCSSPNAMASLISNRDRYDIATGNDADSDRHGIVTPDAGLMNPNHFLTAAIDYLFRTRTGWPEHAGIGKTLVSSSMIDRVAESLGRTLVEVPVGFKHFVSGLRDGSLGFGGEESAGASFLQQDGSVWTTDKDGIILALLASEMRAKTGQSPSQRYAQLTERFGEPAYARVDAPATREQKEALKRLSAEDVTAEELAGEPITAKLTRAPGNGEPIGGLKVTTRSAWFAARPSGTEDVYKIYAESFRGPEHLKEVQAAARELIG